LAQLTIEVNGRPYLVGCEDGQEERLAALATQVDEQVRRLARDVGSLGETRLILMCALLMADELSDLRAEAEALHAEVAEARAGRGRAEVTAVAALEGATTRIEKIAAG